MMKCYVLFLFVCSIDLISAVIYKLTDEQYEWMPPLLRLDPYTACMKHPRALYCTAHITYVADRHNELLHMMQEYSEHKTTHFNRTRAVYGTCFTQKCNHYTYETEEDLHKALGACLNETLYKEYQLKAITEDIRCNYQGNKDIKTNSAFKFVKELLLLIVLLNIVGTLYDVYAIKKNYGLLSHFLLAFSIPRNWNKLNAPAAAIGDPRLRRLKSIHGLRGISMLLVVMAHSFLPTFVLNSSTKFIENRYESTYEHILLNGTVIMQTFFIISSFLLTYNLELLSEKHPFTWTTVVLATIKRWLRLTPAYALVLGFTATWFRYMGSGPLWDKIVTIESEACEDLWWTHLLYINNYFDGSHCMPQTWYLAADTQLYVLGLIIYLICRKTNRKKLVLSTLFIVGMIIPAIHTYVQDLDGNIIISPAAATSFFTDDVTFNKVYKRGHTNIIGYVIGISVGFLVYNLQKKQIDCTKYKMYRPLYWLMYPMALVIILSCKVFYADAPRPHILLRVLVSAFIRPAFAMLMATLLFGMIFKYENLYRSILEWSGWTTLSRVSYSAYLIHVNVIRGFGGMYREPFPDYYSRLAEFLITCVTVTYFLGYIFWITVESPLGQVAKMYVDRILNTKQPKQENNIEEEMDEKKVL